MDIVGLELVIWGQSVPGAAGTPQSLLLKGSGVRSVGGPSAPTQHHGLSTVQSMLVVAEDLEPTPRFLYVTLTPTLRRRQWNPTPVFLPGKSHGRRSLGRLQFMRSLRVGHD